MATTGDEVKLLGTWYRPFVARVRIALNINGVGYQFFEEAPGTKSQLLLESSPAYKKIPVLIHNGKPICESIDKIPNSLRIIAVLEGEKAEAVKEIVTTPHQLEDAFKKCDKGANFFSYLDIAVGCYFGWLKAVEKMLDVMFLDEEKAPVLAEWAKRFGLDDTMANVMPVDKLVEISKVKKVAQ